jgi:NAD(P)-dependent dehydrogenase (short-subunit alcohol dehydrogenase family)
VSRVALITSVTGGLGAAEVRAIVAEGARKGTTMSQATVQSIAALLDRAGNAHGAYEESQLAGVYDRNWPTWYATYLVEHGIEGALDMPVTVEQLAAQLKQYDDAYKREQPAEGWPMYYARQLLSPAS